LSSNQDDKQTVFSTLERQYDAVLTRRATLSGQASSLLTFAGVIQTIIVAPLVAFATSPEAKTLLQSNPYIQPIEVLFGLGFAAYILTVALSILSYRETVWIPAPQIVSSPEPGEWRKELDRYNSTAGPKKFEFTMYEMQLMEAITTHQLTNNQKYKYLSAGYVSLFVGIALTVIAGYLLLLGTV
jgi:hypothetical protein